MADQISLVVEEIPCKRRRPKIQSSGVSLRGRKAVHGIGKLLRLDSSQFVSPIDAFQEILAALNRYHHVPAPPDLGFAGKAVAFRDHPLSEGKPFDVGQ